MEQDNILDKGDGVDVDSDETICVEVVERHFSQAYHDGGNN